MKTSTLLLIMFVGFLTLQVTAQKTLWLDANGKQTTKEKASYYRPTPQVKDNGFWIVDYYTNGKKQMEGFSSSNVYNNEDFEGVLKYYFNTGILSNELNYSEGKLEGNRKEYYESGELKEVLKYVDGKRDGAYKAYYKNGKIETRGKYRNDEKVGIWKTFYKNVYK